MSQIVFRLKTAIEQIGITEPIIFLPEISEPVKWSDIELIGEVDDKYHGFNYNYSEGDLKLEFTCESAHTLLSDQYYRYGIDAVVSFMVVEVARDKTETIEYNGRVDFETIAISPGRVSASVVLDSIHDKISSRWESAVAMDAHYTLDQEFISPPSAIELPLPGMTIHEAGELRRQGNYASVSTFDKGGFFFIVPDMLPTQAEQTKAPSAITTAVPPYPALSTLSGVSYLSGGAQLSEPQPILGPIDTAGLYRIELDWLLKVEIALTKAALVIGKAKFLGWNLEPYAVVKVPGNPNQTIPIAPRLSGSGEGTTTGSKTINAKYYADLDLPANASVLVYIKVLALNKQRIKQLAIYINTINLRVFIDRKTRAAATRTAGYGFSDALRQVVGVITSAIGHDTGTGRVTGSLIGQADSSQPLPGYATEYVVASGLQLRGQKKAPTFTLKTLMETLWAHHVAGMLYERDSAGLESIRIEQGDWFYRGDEILKIEEVYEYREEPDNDLSFNRIVVGYEKFPDSGAGVAEEFNTTRDYQTPIVSRDAKLEILCPLIGAGTAIEEARRLGIKKTDENGVETSTATEAGPYDDDGFILHVAPQENPDFVQFIVRPPQPFPGKPYEAHYIQLIGGVLHNFFGGKTLKNGDVLTFTGTGTPNDGVPYTIIGSGKGSGLGGGFLPTYEVFNASPMIPTERLPTQWSLAGQPAKLRTNERLDVEGVTDPDTAYNLELSPGRMLRKHARFINSGLAYKKPIDTIRCTAYKHNGKLITQVKPNVGVLPGDSDRQLVRDTGDVDLGSLERFEKIFTPEKMFVKARLTRAMQRELFAAMQNRHPETGKNCGYISVLNGDGVFVEGYLRKISYNTTSEVATLVLRKKRPAIAPGGPQCQDYRDHTYGRFETDPTADPNLYRFCRFSDFA